MNSKKSMCIIHERSLIFFSEFHSEKYRISVQLINMYVCVCVCVVCVCVCVYIYFTENFCTRIKKIPLKIGLLTSNNQEACIVYWLSL